MDTSDAYKDWQVQQAERALRLYFANFKTDAAWSAPIVSTVIANRDGTYGRTPTLEAMRTQLRLKHYSYSTEKTYLDWVVRFLGYLKETGHEAHEDSYVLSSDRIRDFLAWLATRKEVAASTQNQALHALLFLFREVLRVDVESLEHGVRAKRGSKLPVVLTVAEVRQVLEALRGTARLMTETLYGGGLRVMECCRLRVKDLDFDNNLIFVRAGKGDKDRSTLLATSVKDDLSATWSCKRPCGRLCAPQASQSRRVCIRFVIRSQLTCSFMARTSDRSRSTWAMRM